MRSPICSDAPLTWIVNVLVVLAPAASAATHSTVVVPAENTAPLWGAQSMRTGATSSVAAAMYETTAPRGLVAFTVRLAPGTVIAGAAFVADCAAEPAPTKSASTPSASKPRPLALVSTRTPPLQRPLRDRPTLFLPVIQSSGQAMERRVR